MKVYLNILIVLFAISCRNEPNETLDFDEFAGDTGLIEDSLVVTTDSVKSDGTALGELIEAVKSEYDTLTLSEGHPMDRFGYSTSRKVQFKGLNEVPYGKTNMVYPLAKFYYYSFADTNKTLNAFYNYLDVIAEEGEGGPVKLNVDVESIKTPPLFMVVYDTVIVAANFMCEHKSNNWIPFQKSILDVFGKEFTHQINIDCGGPLKWK